MEKGREEERGRKIAREGEGERGRESCARAFGGEIEKSPCLLTASLLLRAVGVASSAPTPRLSHEAGEQLQHPQLVLHACLLPPLLALRRLALPPLLPLQPLRQEVLVPALRLLPLALQLQEEAPRVCRQPLEAL
ncbi:hypothetical protein EYF80_042420 [Liparis tanakae]|uniref:Uncharacterized protein n=1 Tax=Liparis tanakae TaxID=230148 RepID=A0A4Z2G1E9_9TELE|nr:hypothetical protein EYF80_042420 [Liparis tanakae]